MSEIICIHIGGAGCRVGFDFWKLMALEHGIGPDGVMRQTETQLSPTVMFRKANSGKYIPRAVFIDCDTDAIDAIRSDEWGALFLPEQFVSGTQGTDGNFAQSYCGAGADLMEPALGCINSIVKDCAAFDGFLITHAIAGGTGSGVTALLLEKLNGSYREKTKICFTIFPEFDEYQPEGAAYNAVLALSRCYGKSDFTVALENSAIRRRTSGTSGSNNSDIRTVNEIIARTISAFTIPLRTSDGENINSYIYQNGYLRFIIASFYPITLNEQYILEEDINTIAKNTLETKNTSVISEAYGWENIDILVFYFGNVDLISASNSITNIKQTTKIVDWSPSGLKVATYYDMPAVLPEGHIAQSKRAALALMNSTLIIGPLENLKTRFERLYGDRKLLDAYINAGLREEEFDEALENLNKVINDYRDVEADSTADDELDDEGS